MLGYLPILTYSTSAADPLLAKITNKNIHIAPINTLSFVSFMVDLEKYTKSRY